MNGITPASSEVLVTNPPSRARTRRNRRALVVVLAVILVAGGVLGWVYASKSPSGSTCGGAAKLAPPTLTPIKHLFVIVKENHAFENYFGNLPGVAGYPPNGSLPLTVNGSTIVHPFPLTGGSTPDFPHDVSSSVTDFDGGRNDLFVAVANAAGDSNPEDAAGYFGPTQLPGYYAYAANYTLGDHFFTGFLGPTFPNRVFDITAYAGSWGSDDPPPPLVSEQTTILDQLNGARIPWDYDWSFSSFELAPTFFPSVVSNPCGTGGLAPITTLPAQLAGGPKSTAVPSVVFVDPQDDPTYSEHPPENITVGEQWTIGVVNTIFSSSIANSSAVLIWFDESGGFWDPLPPPLTSTGRDGFRVPFLVLSPWTPAGRVCTDTLDPAAVLRFIDQNWGLPFLNSRVANASGLSCFFNFSSIPRAPLLLSNPVLFPVPPLVTLRAAVLESWVVPLDSPGQAMMAVWRE